MLKKWEKRLDKVIKYLTVAGKKAMAGAGLPWEGPEMKELDRQRCGILIGTAMGGMDTFARAVEALHTSGAPWLLPLLPLGSLNFAARCWRCLCCLSTSYSILLKVLVGSVWVPGWLTGVAAGWLALLQATAR